MAAGEHHCLAVLGDGSVVAWGTGRLGRCGDAAAADVVYQAHGVGTRATAVAAGEWHSLALLEDGAVVAWGRNTSGQLGDGTTTARDLPVRVVGLGGAPVRAIGAGAAHSMALLTDGTVVAWGNNFKGQLGDGTTTDRTVPVSVAGLDGGVTALAVGDMHCLAVLRDGTVMAWGFNRAGVLGDGTTLDRSTPVPVLDLEGPVSAVAAGAYHCLALLGDGSVLSWGGNYDGQLGDGTTTRQVGWDTPGRARPIPAGLLNAPVIGVAAGGHSSFALMGDGSVLGWGSNQDGQLGDGTGTPRFSPVPLNGAVPVRSLASARGTTLALAENGRIVTWGGRYPRSDYDDNITLGAAKLGGRPDLPIAAVWPASGGALQSFLGQIDLAEVAAVSDKPLGLPYAGLLSFFYDVEKKPDGYSPADQGGWHVIFTEPGAELHRLDFPAVLPLDARYPGVRVRLEQELCLPAITSREIDGVTLDGNEWNSYQRLLSDLDSSSVAAHRLRGYENPIQTGDDPQLVCDLGANGVEYLNRSPEAVALQRQSMDRATEWNLLLQIDEDDEVGFQWGDAGRIYYWIRDDDLGARRLDRAWLMYQCG